MPGPDPRRVNVWENEDLMKVLLTVIYAILLFCLLIFIHEFGHFIVAKACGVRVNEFSVGMGPALIKRKKGETEYSVRLLPVGGFCAMEGEDEDSDDPRAFNRKPAWQRMLVIAAGPAMNFVLAVIIMCALAFAAGTPTTSIGEFTENSRAQEAGLETGDRLLEVNGSEISEWTDVSESLEGCEPGEKATIVAERDGRKLTVETELVESGGRALIGIMPARVRDLGTAVSDGFISTFSLTKQMYVILKGMVTGEVSTRELSGPVGIVYVVSQSVSQGVMYFCYLLAMLSLNLAVINLIPFPALDGGRILFIIIRKMTGKAISDEVEWRVNLIGLLLLFGLMIYVTWNDISRFIVPRFK